MSSRARPSDPERRTFSFTGAVWVWEGPASWHFVSLPPEVADEIEWRFGARAAGFGSIRVGVCLGASRWETSIFPDRSRETYLLPLKKDVRRRNGVVEGSTVAVELTVR